MEGHVEALSSVKEATHSELGTSSNIIPMTISLGHQTLSKFRLFKWMYQNDTLETDTFDELVFPTEIFDIQQQYVDISDNFQLTQHIFDAMIFQNMINEIRYFNDIQLITEENKNQLKEELFNLSGRLEELAKKGQNEQGNQVKIYISNINFEATYSYAEIDKHLLSLIRVYAINAITTQDPQISESLKNWIQSLKKFSTLISESGEMQRIHFFKKQCELIEAL